MGNFLAAPITEKETETGKGNGLFFGVSAMQGWRSSMEDSHIAEVSSSHFPPGCSVFAVCDGHGGKFTADKAAECMVDMFAETMNQRGLFANASEKMPAPKDIGACMRDAYMALDARIKETPEVQYGSDQSGCTAISAFVTSTHIIVANSGDSRSVLAKNGRTVPMSYDHKPKNETERHRIENAGGVVRINRVNGDLAVSRALGDFTYKQRNDLRAEEQQVSAEPEIEVEERDGSEEFLIIACDGIWDVMTNDDACNHVRMLMERGESDMGLIAEDVLDVCLKLGSRDNMSVVVVRFPGAKIGSGDGVAGIRRERAEIEAEAQKDNDTEDDQDETDGAASH